MKRANFPARKLKRQIGALQRFKPVDPAHRSSAQKAVELAALERAVHSITA